jgi:hypothetical protein
LAVIFFFFTAFGGCFAPLFLSPLSRGILLIFNALYSHFCGFSARLLAVSGLFLFGSFLGLFVCFFRLFFVLFLGFFWGCFLPLLSHSNAYKQRGYAVFPVNNFFLFSPVFPVFLYQILIV